MTSDDSMTSYDQSASSSITIELSEGNSNQNENLESVYAILAESKNKSVIKYKVFCLKRIKVPLKM